jgi:hypothetical protein
MTAEAIAAAVAIGDDSSSHCSDFTLSCIFICLSGISIKEPN